MNRPAHVSINNTSGLAGIAYWINDYYELPEGHRVDKREEIVAKVKAMVDAEYEAGRNSVMGDDELDNLVRLADKKRHKQFLMFGE